MPEMSCVPKILSKNDNPRNFVKMYAEFQEFSHFHDNTKGRFRSAIDGGLLKVEDKVVEETSYKRGSGEKERQRALVG